jgi:hypothetical protein
MQSSSTKQVGARRSTVPGLPPSVSILWADVFEKTQIQSKVTLTSAAMVTILFEVIWFISPKEF